MTFYRRNLPHWHPEGKSIFITWRLYGSLPASLMRKKSTGRNACATNTSESEDSPGKQFLQLDAALDSAKHGPLWLAARSSPLTPNILSCMAPSLAATN